MNGSIYEVELTKAQIKDNEPVFVGFLILWFGKHQMLEIFCYLNTKFCDVNKLQELELATDLLCLLAFAEEELEDSIRPEMKAEWEQFRSKDCNDGLIAPPPFGKFFL